MKTASRLILTASVAGLLNFAASPRARAVVLYDKLFTDDYLNNPINLYATVHPITISSVPFGTTTWDAQPFVTGNAPASLTSVTFQLGGARAISDSRTFELDLYSDGSANIPDTFLSQVWVGTVLAAGIPHLGEAYGRVVFGGLNQALAANTIYWLVVRGTDEPTLPFDEQTSPLFDAIVGDFNVPGSVNLADAVVDTGPLELPWVHPSVGGMAAKIEATPEPGSAALLMCGGALLAIRRRQDPAEA